MMRKILILFSMVLFFKVAHGQNNYQVEANKVIPPSPTAAGLGKYGEFGSSGLATGNINVSVPVYSVSHHDINLPISLSYNGGGVRPSDIPGWVGLAWNLNAGGVITRVVNDIPDDVFTPDIGYYHGRSSLAAVTGFFPNVTMQNENIDRHRDFKPDKFIFNFNGESGKFFFDLNGNPVMEGQRKFKIEFDVSYGSNHGMSEFFDIFYITAEDGTKYEFSAKEWTQYRMVEEIPKYYVSSWYLTKIVSPSGNELVLTYTATGNKFRYSGSTFEKVVLGSASLNYQHNFSQSETVTSQSKHETIYLKDVSFGKGKIEFKTSVRNDMRYQPTYAVDVAVESKLDSVIVLYDGKVQKKFAFGYSEPTAGRLKLTSLMEYDAQNYPLAPHLFEYNPVQLPASGNQSVNSFNTNDIDYWGYYNGMSNGISRLPITRLNSGVYAGNAIRTVNPVTAQAEILTKISYPTGGYSRFTYEGNDYSMVAENLVSGVDYEWSDILHFLYDGSGFEADPHQMQFVLSEESVVQVWGTCDSTGPESGWCGSVSQYPSVRKLPAGIYTMAEIFNTDALLNAQNNDIGLAHGFLKYRYAKPVNKKLGGGLRIAKIENYDGQGKLTEKRYEYKNILDPNRSSGVLSKEPIYLRYLGDFWPDVVSGFTFQSEPLEAMPDGSPLIYSSVREIFSDGGYIDHLYTTYEDYPDLASISNIPNEYTISGYTSRAYMRGMEYETRTYNNLGVMIRKNSSEFTEYTGNNKDVVSYDVRVLLRVVIAGEPDPGIAGLKAFGTEKMLTAWVMGKTTIPSRFYMKTKEITTEYNGGEPLVSEKRFAYNTNHLQLSNMFENKSNWEMTRVFFKYPYDYNVSVATPSSEGVLALQQKNMVNKIVEQYTEIWSPVQVSKGYVNGIYNKYNSSGLLSSVYSFKNELPLTSFSPSAVSGNNIVFDSGAYVERLQVGAYDEKGNVVEQQKAGGTISSYKWGYEKRYPIAEAKNAAANEVYVEDFEELAGATVGAAHTGTKFYNGGYTVNWAAPNSRSYQIDYWYLDAGIWRLKREAYTSPSMVLTGGTAYDDIRVYPTDAQISTYTYKPLVGMDRVTDWSGRLGQYEYDTYGRLLNVKDHNGDIVKNYGYYFRNNAPTPIYYNVEKKQKIYRNNCVSPAIAGYAWYVVPANKYSATSQAAADALANAELATNGQSYANTAAGCVTLLPVTTSTEAIDNSGYISNIKIYQQGSPLHDYDPSAVEHSLTPGTYTFEITVIGDLYSDIYGTGYGALLMQGDGIDAQCLPHPNGGTTSTYSFTVTIEAGTYINFNVVAGACN